SIGPAASRMDDVEVGSQCRVRVSAWRCLPMQVVIEAGGRHRQHSTQQPDRKESPLASDEGVLHLDSLAKNAVAFFKMSRSILSVAFSARSRSSSLSISLTGTREIELTGRSARDASSQLASVLTDISSCRAA